MQTPQLTQNALSALLPAKKQCKIRARMKRKPLPQTLDEGKEREQAATKSPVTPRTAPALEELALFLEIDLLLGQKKRFNRRLKDAFSKQDQNATRPLNHGHKDEDTNVSSIKVLGNNRKNKKILDNRLARV